MVRRIGYQVGGIQEHRQLQPEYIEALGKTYAGELTRQAGIPAITTAVQQQPGETAAQWQQRQAEAQQFGIRKAGMAELAPQVAAQDPYQTAAYQQAVDPTFGLGAYQPHLTTAAGLTGPGAYQAYMSPYQQDVIDKTLAEFDVQAQKGLGAIGTAAIGSFTSSPDATTRLWSSTSCSTTRLFKRYEFSTTNTRTRRTANCWFRSIRWGSTATSSIHIRCTKTRCADGCL